MKILFLDLDGTIRCPKSQSKFINSPQDQEPIPGAKEAIANYASQGYLIIGITNQGGVAANHKSMDNCIQEQQYTLKLFPRLSKIFFAPDYSGDAIGIVNCDGYSLIDAARVYRAYSLKFIPNFRKPGTGMIDYGLASNNSIASDCLMVGDRSEDEGCAKAAGLRFMWADNWRS